MKYLERKINDLLLGRQITYRNMVYWANTVTMEIYGQSYQAALGGSINGYKIADITPDLKIVKVK